MVASPSASCAPRFSSTKRDVWSASSRPDRFAPKSMPSKFSRPSVPRNKPPLARHASRLAHLIGHRLQQTPPHTKEISCAAFFVACCAETLRAGRIFVAGRLPISGGEALRRSVFKPMTGHRRQGDHGCSGLGTMESRKTSRLSGPMLKSKSTILRLGRKPLRSANTW